MTTQRGAEQPSERIALTGMAARFPGPDSGPGSGPGSGSGSGPGPGSGPDSRSLDGWWRMLLDGTEAVRDFTPAELRSAGVPDDLAADPRYVPRAADLPGIEHFDAAFFGIIPAEARLMDPQHRIFLECVWAALEDAGTPPGGADGPRVGVFGSTSLSSYLLHHVLRSPEFRGQAFTYPVLLGNDKDFLATRAAYALDLRGPAVTVQSACSGSLVAVDEACAALRSRRCDVAVAGGVSVFTPQTVGYRYEDGGTFARDGHCRPFDAGATGMVRGNGCGVVVLRRHADALADRDDPYALIAATAVNNDGALKAGYSAPGAEGQEAAVRSCLDASGVRPSAVGYVEAHGTGTYLGDPIEVAALHRAFEATGDPPDVCALGSVKANIGHLDAAAGIAGLIKTALVLRHQRVPAQATFREPNPELRLADTPFTVRAQTAVPDRPIEAAGVSSLGIGGTNAHCVLTAAPAPGERAERGEAAGGRYVLPLSAPDDERLRAAAADLLDHLERHPGTRLDDLAYTLRAGRAALRRRAVVTASTPAEAVAGLREVHEGRYAEQEPEPEDPEAPEGGTRELPGARRLRLPGVRLLRERHWVEGELAPTSAAAEPAIAEPAIAEPAAGPAEAAAEVFRRRLGLDAVGPDDDYFQLGGDSLHAVGAADELARLLDVPLSLERFLDLRTPRRIAEWYAPEAGGTGGAAGSAGPAEESPLVLVREGRRDGAAPVFLIHPSGGTVTFAYALAAHSTYDGPLYAVGYPTALLATLTTVPAMARHYLALVRRERPHGPYLLGGYSLGGLVALEMAGMLREAGEPVGSVLLFDTVPPSLDQRALTEREFTAAFPALLRLTLGLPEPDRGSDGGPDGEPAAVPPRTVDEALASVRQPDWDEATERRLRTLYEVWRVCDRAQAEHRPRPYAGPVRLFRAERPVPEGALPAGTGTGTDDAVTDTGEGEGTGEGTATGTEWDRVLTGELRVTRVPGHHFAMFAPPRVSALATAYDRALAEEEPGAVTGPTAKPSRPEPEPEPEPVVLLFPGQGSQHARMGEQLLGRYPELVREADGVLGYSIASVCAGEDPDRPLTDTAFAQPALFVVGALALRAYREEHGQEHGEQHGEAERPVAALGHSLGEYNALEAAGVFTFAECLRLVAGRGAAMARIGGGMVAVSGPGEDELRDLLAAEADEATGTAPRVDLSAANTRRQHTLSGPDDELAALTPVLLDRGARSVRRLDVSGPFHSGLMGPAADEFRAFAEELGLAPREPAFPVLANTTAAPHAPGTVLAALAAQIDHPVRWLRSVEHVLAVHGEPRFRELGARRVLTPLVRQIRTAGAGDGSAGRP